MKQTITLLLIFFTGFLSAQTVSIQGGSSYPTINDAIFAAASGDVILITGVHTGTFTVDKSITLRGTNPLNDIIQANALPATAITRVIAIAGASALNVNVTIENLGIKNGNIAAANGGGINIDKITGLVTLKNLIIENNKTAANGGAIGIAGSNVDIIECTLKNNTSTLDGGAIIASPNNGALIDNVVNIKQSLINANVGRNGGGIYINGNLTFGNTYKIAVNIENSTVSNNSSTNAGTATALAGGGAICSNSQPLTTNTAIGNVTLNLIHATLYGNSCPTLARAGIQFNSAKVTNFSAYNSIIVGNDDLTATGPKAINFTNTNITNIVNCIFGGTTSPPAIVADPVPNANNNQPGKSAAFAGITGTLTSEGGSTQVFKLDTPANTAVDYCTVATPGVTIPIIDQRGYTRTGFFDAGAYELPLYTWTGLTSTAWTVVTNWDNGVPISTSNVVIGTGPFQPTIASNVAIKSLTIATGASLDVTSGNLTVTGAVANNGIMILENNANLIQGGTTNTNTGNVIVKRNSSSLLRLDYTLWSSPVAGQNLAAFSPLTSQSPNRFYTYDAATDLYANVDPLTTSFAPGNGYLIRMPNDASAVTPTAFAGVFTGVPNNGNIILGSVTPLIAGKFYSVGNPYPSPVSASLFIAGTTGLGSTLYFWRKTNNTPNGTDPSGNGTAYATWTSLGGTASGNVAPNDLVPNGQIAVGQGFIVNTGTATTINFTNSMRTTAAVTFLKTKAAATPDRVWLNLTNATGAFSQTLIGYNADATLGVDNGIDGEYINDSPLALTSNINNKEYTIQGRPTFDPTDVVALNFKTDVAGDYTIAIDHFDGLFATGQDIFLADSKTGAETDLKAGSYTFAATAGVDNARFSLKYQKTLKVDAPAFNENSVSVYKNNGALYVNSGTVAISNIKVYDIQGRLIAEQKNVKATSAVIANLRARNQVLIVKIAGEDNNVVTKKVVN